MCSHPDPLNVVGWWSQGLCEEPESIWRNQSLCGGPLDFSVSPRPFGVGFETKGLGPGLDNNRIFYIHRSERYLCTPRAEIFIPASMMNIPVKK